MLYADKQKLVLGRNEHTLHPAMKAIHREGARRINYFLFVSQGWGIVGSPDALTLRIKYS